jgi:FixJ family two-component response regulator
LGLYQAATKINTWGGKINIESKTGKGTTVIITLPKESAPDWFVPHINIYENSCIVILDDDNSIHEVWKNKLDSLKLKHVNIHYFLSPQEFILWYEENKKKYGHVVFLFDYELLGFDRNGLEIADEMGIAGDTILVTSRFEEDGVHQSCGRLGVKMVPKNLAMFVPLHVIGIPDGLEYILIDDSTVNRAHWELMARMYHKKLITFGRPNEFYTNMNKFDKNANIYIDANLSNGVKGEDVAKDLSKKGFERIYITTGYPLEEYGHKPWIKGVIDKTPPFVT